MGEYQIIDSDHGRVLVLSSNRNITVIGNYRDSKNYFKEGRFDDSRTYLAGQGSIGPPEEQIVWVYVTPESNITNVHFSLVYNRSASELDAGHHDNVVLIDNLSVGWNSLQNTGEGTVIGDTFIISRFCMIIIFIEIVMVIVYIDFIKPKKIESREKQRISNNSKNND